MLTKYPLPLLSYQTYFLNFMKFNNYIKLPQINSIKRF